MSAPISHGRSGGPVFDAKEEVFAITAATIEEGQNLNFAVPIDYARGMLSSTQARPLAAIYEPVPENDAPAATAGKSPVDEMQSGSLVYLEGKLRKWKEPDARKVLGEPFTHLLFIHASMPLAVFQDRSEDNAKFGRVLPMHRVAA